MLYVVYVCVCLRACVYVCVPACMCGRGRRITGDTGEGDDCTTPCLCWENKDITETYREAGTKLLCIKHGRSVVRPHIDWANALPCLIAIHRFISGE